MARKAGIVWAAADTTAALHALWLPHPCLSPAG